MIQLLKKLFCGHQYEMTRWHWTHGPTGMEPRQIEAELKCANCGKTKYWHVVNPRDFKRFVGKYGDKQI